MPEPVIAVSGATGHIGSELCKLLIAAGVKPRALVRDSAKVKALGAVEPALGSLDDAMYLKKALSTATAAFAMIPPNMATTDFRGYARRIVKSWVEALQASPVTHVVALSSIGGDLPEGTGPIAALHEMEQQFATLKANVLFLRPTYFLENHLAGVGMVKGMGIYGSALRPDLAIAQIATRDIAAVAAKRLLARDFTGKSVLELLGAKDYTMPDVARTLGKEIGKADLAYVQFPYEDAEKAMVGAGLSADMSRLYIEMSRAFNEGRIKATQGRSPATTTPTTLGQFAKVFAAAYKSQN